MDATADGGEAPNDGLLMTGIDWQVFTDRVDTILNAPMESDDPCRAAALTSGLSIGGVHFAVVRATVADIEAASVSAGDDHGGFALRLAALPYRLRLLVLENKGWATPARQVTDEVVRRISTC